MPRNAALSAVEQIYLVVSVKVGTRHSDDQAKTPPREEATRMAHGRHAAPRRAGRSRMTVVAVATPVVVLGAGAIPAGATAASTCYGRDATMVVSASSPATVKGTSERDVIVITGGRHTIWAGSGDDVICGGDAADVVHGGPGDDRIYGEAGADRLYGGLGNDRLFGSIGRDVIRGGLGNDHLSGGNGPDLLDGSIGDDSFLEDGHDTLLGLEDDETYAPPA